MWNRTIAIEIMRLLGEERRRIVADWRILILARRIAQRENAPLPDSDRTNDIVKALHGLGLESSCVHGIYRVDSPFASAVGFSDEQIVQESHPLAVFSHWTAISLHALTDQIPDEIVVTNYRQPETGRLPLGTTPEDWVDLDLPRLRMPKSLDHTSVRWIRGRRATDFGTTVMFSQGIPIYVSDLERTLVDAAKSPAKSGSISNVFKAWRGAIDQIDLDVLVKYTDQFDEQVLRQRIGYILETMGLHHHALDRWQKSALRGGSVKLVASGEYAKTYSERWNLSLNVPEAALMELRE